MAKPTVKPVPASPKLIELAGNEWYPLPPDYQGLSADGQRDARVNACCLRDTPDSFLAAWLFFRAAYLEPSAAAFYKRHVESPPGHHQWVRDIAAYGRNIHAAPRGSSKSTIIGLEIPLLLALTRPRYDLLEVLSIHKLVRRRLGKLQLQLTENPQIVDDFGYMKPPKGGGRQWSLAVLELNNGSVIEGTSVEGRKRGARPDMILLDDPEYDPANPAAETALTGQLEQLLFKELFGMFDTSESVFEWMGTLLSCKSALYHAVMGQDSRFKHFNRRIYSASREDPATGNVSYFWPAKWNADALAMKRSEMGDVAYEAEFNNNPVSQQARLFALHEDLHFYSVLGDDVVYFKPDGERATLKYDQWLSSLGRLFTVDILHKSGIASDFNSILVIGVDAANWWWVLDLELGRYSLKVLMEKIWELGLKWRPSVIGIESAAGQIAFAEWAQDHADQLDVAKIGWQPRVFPIRYPPRVSKEDRETSLSPRFTRFMLRLPTANRERWPMSELIRQITLFTPDGASLDHDDAIDTLAMVPFCPIRAPGTHDGSGVPSDDFLTQIAEGNIRDRLSGLPLTSGIDISEVPLEIVKKFLDARQKVAYSSKSDRESALTRRNRWRR